MKDLVKYINTVGASIPKTIEGVSELGVKKARFGEDAKRFFGFYELTGFRRFWWKVKVGYYNKKRK